MGLIAITGGTGFLGLHLARTLVDNGHFARLIARGSDRQREQLARKMSNVTFHPISLTDESKLFKEFCGCTAVAHLAGVNREHVPGEFHDLHVQGTLHVLNAARRAEVKKIVYVSYLRARPTRTSGYLNSKWEAEELVRGFGLDYTIVKPGMIYGSGDQMIHRMVDGLRMFPGVGIWPGVGFLEKPINPLAVQDLMKIMVAALVSNRLSKQTVAAIGPEEITLTQAVYRVAKAIKRPAVVVPVPVLAQYVMALAMEKTMRDPLVSFSQIRMLSEGMNQPLPQADPLPEDLVAKTPFDEAQILAALSDQP